MKFIPRYIVIHHSATSDQTSVEDIRNYHLSKGWEDIGYHFLIDNLGEVHKGRDEKSIGAHALGLNDESLGICCIGNYEEGEPSSKLMSALFQLVDTLTRRYGIESPQVIGHRDTLHLSGEAKPTACPGRYLYEKLPLLRSRIKPPEATPRLARSPRAIVRGSLAYDAKLDVGQPTFPNLKSLQLIGTIENIGSAAWENILLKRDEAFRIGVRITHVEPRLIVWEGRASFESSRLRPGESSSFEITIDIADITPGIYELELCPLKEKSFWFSDYGFSPVIMRVSLPPSENSVTQNSKLEVPPLAQEIILSPVSHRKSFLYQIRGAVKNVGSVEWKNSEENLDTPYRMGAVLIRKGEPETPLWESRYDFPGRSILPNSTLQFRFDINTADLEAGEYGVLLSMVRERRFWFYQYGGDPTIVPITVEASARQTTLRQCVRSFALGKKPEDTRILFITPTLPLFDRETGGRRLMDIFELLREIGFSITLAYESPGCFDSPEPYLARLKKIGITTVLGPLSFLSDLMEGDFDACVLGWYKTARNYFTAISEVLPDAKIIVDSVDIHWVREQRGKKAGELQVSDKEIAENKSIEVGVYSRSDEVWAVTEEDREAILNEIPDCVTKIVSNMSYKRKDYIESPTGRGVIFVGGFAHPPNEGAAMLGWEACQEFRKLTGEEFTYYIVGGSPTQKIRALHDGVRTVVTGQVPDLIDYFKLSRVMLAPVIYGAGIKGKICDSICYGIPVITTSLGNEGIGLRDREEGFIAEDISSMVQALKEVFSDGVDLKLMNQKALARVLEMTGKEAARDVMTRAFTFAPVVISIVTFNRLDLLERCLKSILNNTVYPDYRIAVVCNGCTDGSREFVEELQRAHPGLIDLHYNSENEYFVRPNNFVIGQYPDRDVVLVNNDIEISSPLWLQSLHDAAYTSARVGASGGKILAPDGLISEAGAELYNNGRGTNLGRGEPADLAKYNCIRYVGFVSGCLLYMKRSAISRFGGLDDDFHPMYYEDCSWQYMLHINGLKTIYTPHAVAIHREGSSAGTDTESGMKRYQEINREKFLRKFSAIDIEKFNEEL